MPSRTRVAEFVSYVAAGKYVEAISDFYAETAFMKENLAEPRVGRENLIRHERAVLAGLAQMRTERVGPVLVDGDRVSINWVFEMTKSRRQEAVARRTGAAEMERRPHRRRAVLLRSRATQARVVTAAATGSTILRRCVRPLPCATDAAVRSFLESFL